MSQIMVSGLTFGYDGSYDNIFEDVSFRLDTSWRLGFIGRNGRGKTTFLRLLMGRYEYKGSIKADMAFEYFPYEIADESLCALDVAEGIAPEAELWQLKRELAVLEAGEDILYRPFCTLSPGERTKLQLAAMFLRHNSFLLIDEPTNNLDARGRELVSRWLCSKSGFILVSHDRVFLDGCIDHVLSINRASIEVQKGNFSTWEETCRLRDEFEQKQNEKLQKEISQLRDAARRTAEWSDKAERSKIGTKGPVVMEKSMGKRSYLGEKSRKMMARAKGFETRMERAADEKSGLLRNVERADSLKMFALEHHAERLVTLEEVSLGYDGRTVLENVSLTITQGERIALRGRNGCGKSSLIKLICGEAIEHTGRVRLASGLIISVVGQDTSHMSGTLSEYAERYGVDETIFKTLLRKLDFGREQFDKDISAFSAGQRKKVLIARSLCENAHLYIWDEPLNYIDVLSRMQIEELLSQGEYTLLFVEHDMAFCENIATRIFALDDYRVE